MKGLTEALFALGCQRPDHVLSALGYFSKDDSAPWIGQDPTKWN